VHVQVYEQGVISRQWIEPHFGVARTHDIKWLVLSLQLARWR